MSEWQARRLGVAIANVCGPLELDRLVENPPLTPSTPKW
jgi:hypothetical protein